MSAVAVHSTTRSPTDAKSDLPHGQVTFVFTDIEASTRLLAHLGVDAFVEVQNRQREIVCTAAVRYLGHVVNTEGDGIFIAYQRAEDALGSVRRRPVARWRGQHGRRG